MKKIFLILIACCRLTTYAQNSYTANTNPGLGGVVPIIVTQNGLEGTSIGSNAFNINGFAPLWSSPRNTFYGSGSGNGVGVSYALTSWWDNTFVGALSGSGTINPSTHTFIGCRAGLNNNVGLAANQNAIANTYVGTDAGNNSVGGSNCFFGASAGRSAGVLTDLINNPGPNTTNNNFFGHQSGYGITGINNCFYGSWDANPPTITIPAIQRQSTNNCFYGNNSGIRINGAINNVFMGNHSGELNSNGNNNVYLGFQTGMSNNTSQNVFVGTDICRNLGAAPNGSNNTFLGFQAGNLSTMTGNNNVSIGSISIINSARTNSIAIGANSNADAGANNTNTIALGANAIIGQDNSMLLGAVNGNGIANGTYMHVGINTNTPGTLVVGQGRAAQLHIFNSNEATELDPWVPALNQTSHARIRFDLLPPTLNPAAEVVVINPATGKLYRRAWNWDCCTPIVDPPIPFVTCTNPDWVPKTNSTGTGQVCSQIWDNGSITGNDFTDRTVAIGFSGASTRNYSIASITSGGYDGPVPMPTTGTLRLDVNGYMRATGYFDLSDRRYKKEIKPIANALDKIKQLNGVTYNWRKDEFKDRNFDNSNQIGFIAQEVEKVIPQAVVKDGDGYYAMNYRMLIPVLTEAMKEQQKMIEQQQKEIDELKAIVKGTTPKSVLDNPVKTIQLFQNVPNPFSKETDIKFFLPETVKQANLTIYDMQGKQLRKIDINERNEASIKINAKELPAGMYMYSLIADGKEMDTKRMILTDY